MIWLLFIPLYLGVGWLVWVEWKRRVVKYDFPHAKNILSVDEIRKQRRLKRGLS